MVNCLEIICVFVAYKWDADYADFNMIFDDLINSPKQKTLEPFPAFHLVVGYAA